MPFGWASEPLNNRVYRLWFDMLRRCYDDEQLERGKGKTYKDCSVCSQWFLLSNFYSDIQKLPGYHEWENGSKMSIDKDLLSSGEKIYSPKTCCFVPISANVQEKNRRNPTNHFANEANKTRYILTRGNERLIFRSEMEACEKLGVARCSIASCYRRGYKCKGYDIARVCAKMDKEATDGD